MKKTIAILGTLDTKGEEVAYMKAFAETHGFLVSVMDIGALGPPRITPDHSNASIATLAGWELADLLKTAERDEIMSAMGKGAAKLLIGLYRDKKIDGVIGLGGNQGSAVASMAMRALPFGFPKFLVSTVASGNIRPYIGYRDIPVMFSVGDMVGGPNAITRSVLTNAMAALVGMIERGRGIEQEKGPKTIGISELGNTERAAVYAVELLKREGFQVITFHASGAGGSAMEALIESGKIQGVLDLTPNELAAEVVGEGIYLPVKPERLSAGSMKGIPQVVSTGGLEYVCFGPRESIPSRFRRRKIYMHNPVNANLKLSRKEMAEVGHVMAERLNLAKGPVAVLIPLKGWSVYGRPGGPLCDLQGNRALVRALRENIKPEIKLEEIDAHINDKVFVQKCVTRLLTFMERERDE